MQQNMVLHKYDIRSLLSCCFLDQQAKYSSPYLKSQEIKACYADRGFLGHHVSSPAAAGSHIVCSRS